MIPTQYLDKTMQKVLSTLPLPNMPYNSSGQNFLGLQGNSASDNRWNTKIDHTFNAAASLFGALHGDSDQ